jgi:hypothetical protein
LQKNFLVTGEIPLGALAFRYRLDSEQFRPHASPSAKARQRSAFRRQTAIAAPPAHAREIIIRPALRAAARKD